MRRVFDPFASALERFQRFGVVLLRKFKLALQHESLHVVRLKFDSAVDEPARLLVITVSKIDARHAAKATRVVGIEFQRSFESSTGCVDFAQPQSRLAAQRNDHRRLSVAPDGTQKPQGLTKFTVVDLSGYIGDGLAVVAAPKLSNSLKLLAG